MTHRKDHKMFGFLKNKDKVETVENRDITTDVNNSDMSDKTLNQIPDDTNTARDIAGSTAEDSIADKPSDIWDLGVPKIDTGNDGSLISETRGGFIIRPEDFGPLQSFVEDASITDIDYNGSDLWLTDIDNRHWKENVEGVTPFFIRRLAQDIANAESKEFNQKNPSLEAETEDLRVSVMHSSAAQTGTTMCIRKTPKTERIKEKKAIEEEYCSVEVLSLLANCIKAHMNIVICGEPRAGKTECAKFISGYIPAHERVITIEDVMEWHYKSLHPTSDVIEIKVNDDFTYSDGIIASLKQNPTWLMIAETRGEEVKNLIQGFTTGVHGITTLHTDDVRKIPERIVNMSNTSATASRVENNVYEFVDVGIFISMHANSDGSRSRLIDQVAFFSEDNGNKKCTVAIEGGHPYRAVLPEKIAKKFSLAGIDNPFASREVDARLKEQGYSLTENDKILREAAESMIIKAGEKNGSFDQSAEEYVSSVHHEYAADF